MSIHNLIAPLGILTFISLALTALSGFAMLKLHIRWVTRKTHISLAVITLIFATMHVAIVMYLNL